MGTGHDLRSTFASNALAAGITVYELARIMGTSVSMIEAHYGALIETARESLLERLESVSVQVPLAARGDAEGNCNDDADGSDDVRRHRDGTRDSACVRPDESDHGADD
jgi:hypothetical protein